MPTYKKSLQTLHSKPIEVLAKKPEARLSNEIKIEQKDEENLKIESLKMEELPIKQLGVESKLIESRNVLPQKEEVTHSKKRINPKKDSAESEFLTKISKLTHSHKKIQKLFRLYIVSFSIIIVAMFTFLVNNNITLSNLEKKLSENSVGGVTSSSKESVNLAPQVENQANTKNIISFQDNPAIFDYGFKIDIQKNSISNVDDQNCKTPIVPPTINGCGFGLNLQNINLPSDGYAFKNLTLETTKTSNKNKIQIDLKDYIKSELVKTVATISSQDDTHKISLPRSIPSSQSLYFRFWTTDEVVKIKKISINYYSITDLKPVKIKLDIANKPSIENPENTLAYIYSDQNEDKKFQKEIDQKWNCEPNFPGISPIKISGNQEINLTRDDACMTTKKPENWSENLVLPSGNWLFVIDESNYYSFEIKPDDVSKSLEIKI